MAAGATDVVIRFLSDVSDIKDGVGKIEGTTSKLKSWAKGIGSAIAGAFAVDKIKEFVDAGAELQDQLSASQVIFGNAAKAVDKWSGTTAAGFGIARADALKAANTFATFGKSAGLSGDQLAGFSTGLTGLAGDMASFRGTSTEQAIEAIGAALRGESEPIRQYGVLLDDATLKNRAMALGLISSTKNALTPQQKVLAAQAEILAQTGDAQGDFARTSDSAANQQKILSAKLKDTEAAIGTALLPAVQALLPILQSLSAFVQENSGWLVPLVGAVLAVTAAVWLFNAALAANPIVLITVALAALVAGIIYAYNNFEIFRTVVDAVIAAAVTAFTWLWATVQTVFGWIVDHWQLLLVILTGPIGAAVALIITYWDTFKTVFMAIFDAVATIVDTWVGRISALISNLVQWVTNIVSPLVGILSGPFSVAAGIITAVFAAAAGAISTSVELIKTVVAGIASAISTAMAGLENVLAAPFRAAWNIISGIVDKILGAVDRVKDAIGGIAGKLGDIGGAIGGVIGLQGGGIVTRPTLAMIGERGPEAVIPLGRGATATAGGGITINVTTTGLGADAPAIQSAVVQALRQHAVRNGPLPRLITGAS